MTQAVPRETLLAQTFVELTDTLVDDFDVVELLTLLADRCVELLDVSAAGLMVVVPGGELKVMASSNEAMRLVELFELQSQDGPCLDCYRDAEPVVNARLDGHEGRWPRFAPVAREAGFRIVHALPMRLRGNIIGALNLFNVSASPLTPIEIDVAQALADVATIALLQHRAVREAQVISEQLQQALNSRIVIEQAKGMLSEATGLNMEEAFTHLRAHARHANLRLIEVCDAVISGKIRATTLVAARTP